jgi:hypothetical protein
VTDQWQSLYKADAMSGPRSDLRQLSGTQLRDLLEAARQLRPWSRARFLEEVTALLPDRCEVGEGELYRAVRTALSRLHLERMVRL